jgi:hypothetical protein
MASISAATMERLAFVRYTYECGVRHSREPEPANSLGVLLFHDAVDLFLQLAAEHLNVAKPKGQVYLADYLGLVDAALKPNASLGGRAAMTRLNSVRTSLKHNGVRPSPLDVEALRANVTSFFEDNVPLVFGIRVDEISMALLVTIHEARSQLEEAERQATAGNLGEAIDACAIAFAYVVGAFHRFQRPAYKKPGFGPSAGSDIYLKGVIEYVAHLAKAVNELQDRVELLTLGIDPAQMRRFRKLTPHVAFTMDGTVHLAGIGAKPSPDATDVRFCYGFVVAAALALQRIGEA